MNLNITQVRAALADLHIEENEGVVIRPAYTGKAMFGPACFGIDLPTRAYVRGGAVRASRRARGGLAGGGVVGHHGREGARCGAVLFGCSYRVRPRDKYTWREGDVTVTEPGEGG